MNSKHNLDDFTAYGPAQKKVKTAIGIDVVDHVYEEIPPLDVSGEYSKQGGPYEEISWDGTADVDRPLHDIYIDRTPSMRPDFCCICKKKVRSLRRHANARHLPWFVDALSACAVCCSQTNHPTMMKHHNAEQHPRLDTRLPPSLWREHMLGLFRHLQQALGLRAVEELPQFARNYNLGLTNLVELNASEQPYFREFGDAELFNPCRPVTMCDCSHWRIILRLISKVGEEQFSGSVQTIKPEEGRIFIRDVAVNRPKEPDYRPPIFFTSQFAVGKHVSPYEVPAHVGSISSINTSCPQQCNSSVSSQAGSISSETAVELPRPTSVSMASSSRPMAIMPSLSVVANVPQLTKLSSKSLGYTEGRSLKSRFMATRNGHAKYNGDNIPELKPNFIRVGFGTRPETCTLCQLDVPKLRMHANARHLPWFVDAATACVVCNTQTVDRKTMVMHGKQHSKCRSLQLEPSRWLTLMMELFQQLKPSLGIDSVDEIPRFVRQNRLGVLNVSNVSDKELPCLGRDFDGQSKPFNPQQPETLHDCCHWRIILRLIGIAGEASVSHRVRSTQPKYATLFVDPTQITTNTMFKQQLDRSLQAESRLIPHVENQASFVSDASRCSASSARHMVSDSYRDRTTASCLPRNMDYPSDTDEYDANRKLGSRQQVEDETTLNCRYQKSRGNPLDNSTATHAGSSRDSRASFGGVENKPLQSNTRSHSGSNLHRSDGFRSQGHVRSVSHGIGREHSRTELRSRSASHCRRHHRSRSRQPINKDQALPWNPDQPTNEGDSGSSHVASRGTPGRNVKDIPIHARQLKVGDYARNDREEDDSRIRCSRNRHRSPGNRRSDHSNRRSSQIRAPGIHNHKIEINLSPISRNRDCSRNHSVKLGSEFRPRSSKRRGRRSFDVPFKRDYEYEQAIEKGRISPKSRDNRSARKSSASKRGESPKRRRSLMSDLAKDFLLNDSDGRSGRSSSCSLSPESARDLQKQVTVLKRGMKSLTDALHNIAKHS